MRLNSLSATHLALNSPSSSTASRPNITFNYIAPTINQYGSPFLSKTQTDQHNFQPFISNTRYQNNQPASRMENLSPLAQILSHRDPKRKKIFAKSHSNKDMLSLPRSTSIQNIKETQWSRQASQSKKARRTSNRKRNHIFQLYNPKAKIYTYNDENADQHFDNLLSMEFDRDSNHKKLTNNFPPKLNNMQKKDKQQAPLITIIAENQDHHIPLRDTYVAERDWESSIHFQQQNNFKQFAQKQYLKIPNNKVKKSFGKRVHSEDMISKSSHHSAQNMQLEQESIAGYSHKDAYIHYENIQDLPSLLQEANQNRYVSKTAKKLHNLFIQTTNQIQIKPLQNTQINSKGQVLSKQITKNAQTPLKESSLQVLPYILVLFGVLLLVIQLLK